MYEETVVVYADILFLINFSLDYLCLFIAGRVINRGGKVRRLLAGAAFGGVYSFLPYIAEFPIYISLSLHLGAAALICFIAFGKSDSRSFFLTLGTFFVTAALMGGLVTAFFNISSRYSEGLYAEVNAISFCAICILSAGIALAYGLISRKKIHTRSARLKIKVSGEEIEANLLCDSGNMVTEPFSALPVIIVSASCLPPPYDMPESNAFPLPLRAIPFSTSGGKGCFLGFRPDRIEIMYPLGKKKTVDAYIGIDTGGTGYSGYDGLLPTSVL